MYARARHVETRHDCTTRTILRQIVRHNERETETARKLSRLSLEEVANKFDRRFRLLSNRANDFIAGLFVPIARTRPVDHTLNLARLADLEHDVAGARARRGSRGTDVVLRALTHEGTRARRRRLEYTHCSLPTVVAAVNAD